MSARAWTGGLLLGMGLIGVACSRQPAKSGNQPQALPESNLGAQRVDTTNLPSTPDHPPIAAPIPEGAPEPPLRPGKIEIKVGMTREQFVEKVGNCAERILFYPGGKKRKVVEVFQSKDGDCLERLGDRRFNLVDLVVESVEMGRVTQAPRTKPIPTDR